MKTIKYYVLCPYNSVTGGPDALHQMVYYLRKLGKTAEIAYCNVYTNEPCVPAPYQIYTETFVKFKNVRDEAYTVIICPETHIHYVTKFKKAKVYIWWLSVDNNKHDTGLSKILKYVLSLPLRILRHPKLYCKFGKEIITDRILRQKYNFENEKDNVTHLCASYYAYEYVSGQSKKMVIKCIEPVSLIFLHEYEKWQRTSSQRENIVLYNPAKSGKQILELKKYDPTIEFVALKGLNQIQLIETYKMAKLFVDFGPFPGAERMPKEAVLFGCSIITGRNGASAYYNDVPISSDYKFDFSDETVGAICDRIHYCLDNYGINNKEFNTYRETVLSLEKNFIVSLKSIFN